MSEQLEVLRDARALAETLGAVAEGMNWFEDAQGSRIDPSNVAHGKEPVDRICHVCVCGAMLLARIHRGEVVSGDWGIDVAKAYQVAEAVAPDEYQHDPLAVAITNGGTPYMLRVLDAMIEQEAAHGPSEQMT